MRWGDRELPKNYSRSCNLFSPSLSVYTFGVLLNGICKNGLIEEVMSLFSSLRDFDVKYVVKVFDIISDGLGRAGKSEKAKEQYINQFLLQKRDVVGGNWIASENEKGGLPPRCRLLQYHHP